MDITEKPCSGNAGVRNSRFPSPGAGFRAKNPLMVRLPQLAGVLILTGQADAIDYHAKNFVHADLTNREFNRLQNERGESLLGFALKAYLRRRALRAVPPPPPRPAHEIALEKLDRLRAMCTRCGQRSQAWAQAAPDR